MLCWFNTTNLNIILTAFLCSICNFIHLNLLFQKYVYRLYQAWGSLSQQCKNL
ncbi:hypothetical protein MIDIC_240044 [Alphaproteobacteria bacterium]